MRRSQQRRSFLRGFSVTSAIASTSTTQRTARRKRRRPTRRHTPPTTAAKQRSGPTATFARSSATGPTLATMTRPFNGHPAQSARVGRQYAVFGGVAFSLRVIVWRLSCPQWSFQAQECLFFCFFFKLRISHLKERGTVFTVFVWEDAVHHLMLILLEQHWSCLRSHNLILRVCTAGGGGGKMIRIYGGGC